MISSQLWSKNLGFCQGYWKAVSVIHWHIIQPEKSDIAKSDFSDLVKEDAITY